MRAAWGWPLRVALAVVAVAVTGGQGEAQRLAQEVFSSGAGRVSFEFPVRDDVEVCEWGIRSNGTRTQWSSREDRRPQRCSEGVAVAVLRIEDRHVLEIDIEPSGGADVGRYIGAFSGPEAAEFFLTIARTETAGGAADAVAPAAFVEGEVVWRDLLDLATDRELRGGVRKAALFWVGQQAADAVTEGLREIADGDPEAEIRESAVFALSQRPEAESVPILMELARTSDFVGVRRSALFWLAQSADDRVPGFFAEILGK